MCSEDQRGLIVPAAAISVLTHSSYRWELVVLGCDISSGWQDVTCKIRLLFFSDFGVPFFTPPLCINDIRMEFVHFSITEKCTNANANLYGVNI